MFCRRVKVDVASHSPQVDALREELVAALSGLHPQPSALGMRSTVTGARVGGQELVASYWADNLRQPVRFAEVIEQLLDDGHGLFVEMSPHPLLATSVEEEHRAWERAGDGGGLAAARADERSALLEALGALWVQGYPVAWERQFAAGGRRVPLPTYPWQRERYWLEAPAEARRAGARAHCGRSPAAGRGPGGVDAGEHAPVGDGAGPPAVAVAGRPSDPGNGGVSCRGLPGDGAGLRGRGAGRGCRSS